MIIPGASSGLRRVFALVYAAYGAAAILAHSQLITQIPVKEGDFHTTDEPILCSGQVGQVVNLWNKD